MNAYHNKKVISYLYIKSYSYPNYLQKAKSLHDFISARTLNILFCVPKTNLNNNKNKMKEKNSLWFSSKVKIVCAIRSPIYIYTSSYITPILECRMCACRTNTLWCYVCNMFCNFRNIHLNVNSFD